MTHYQWPVQARNSGQGRSCGLWEGFASLLAVCVPLFTPSSTAHCQEAVATDPSTVAPGELRLGSAYLRPYFTLSRLGYDTNVFNSTTDPVSDFVAEGGPGLEARRPFGSKFELRGGGYASYLYYQDSVDQRGWSGGAYGAAVWTGNRTEIGGRYSFSKRFARPEFEIDDRIDRSTWLTSANLGQKIGSRWQLALAFNHTKTRYDEGRTSEGADPAANRNQNRYLGVSEFAYSLTEKTDILFGVDQQWDRFETALERDADSNRIWLGLRLASQTRLSGVARGGARRINYLAVDSTNSFPYADVRLGYSFGPRTLLSLLYELDREFTFFNNLGDQPTSRREVVQGQLDKGLWGDLEIRFFGRFRGLKTDDPVGFVNEDGSVTLDIRDDKSWEAGANLGYLFKRLVRLGFEARYLDRQSNQAAFTVNYWQFGATIEVVPRTIQ